MKRLILAFAIFFGMTLCGWSQDSLGDFPEVVKAEDATITHLGHATMTVENGTIVDIEWDTPSDTAKQRTAERGNNPNGSGFYNQGHNGWLDIYYYNFNYPSIND